MALPAIGAIGSIGSLASTGAPTGLPAGGTGSSTGGTSFGGALESALGKLTDLQNQANQQSQLLATGQSTDVTSVVMAVEKASVSLELASQVRNKAVEAYQDIFRMQV
jgi:flagellar hook-basal body complex protein FliE